MAPVSFMSAGRIGLETTETGRRLAGQYMAFQLDSEDYAVELLRVREIIPRTELHATDGTTDLVPGVIVVRGERIAVIDPRVRFGLPPIEPTSQSVIILVQHPFGVHTLTVGLMVDEVRDVLNLEPSHIEPPPSFGADPRDTAFVLGIGKVGPRVVFLLNLGRMLSRAEFKRLVEMTRLQ